MTMMISVALGYIAEALRPHYKEDMRTLGREIFSANGSYDLENILSERMSFSRIPISIEDENLGDTSKNILRDRRYREIFNVYGSVPPRIEQKDYLFLSVPFMTTFISEMASNITNFRPDIKEVISLGVGMAIGMKLRVELERRIPRSVMVKDLIPVETYRLSETEFLINMSTPDDRHYQFEVVADEKGISDIKAYNAIPYKKNIFSKTHIFVEEEAIAVPHNIIPRLEEQVSEARKMKVGPDAIRTEYIIEKHFIPYIKRA